MSLPKLLPAILFTVLLYGSARGQAARTPFSSFAIGEYYGNSQVHTQGMAGVSISNPQYFFLNNQNPALLVFNEVTTFQAGLVGERRKVTDGTSTERNNNGNLSYFLLGFPMKRGKWVTSVGLMPYTTVHSKYTYSRPVEGTTAVWNETEDGSGGINQLSWSHGVALHKYLSIGARANYLFGSIENKYISTVILPDQQIRFEPYVLQQSYYKDFSFTGAVSFHRDSLFSNRFRINVGLVYDFKTNIRTQLFEALQRIEGTGNTVVDTLTSSRVGQTTLPPSLGLGISFGAERWMAGVDWRTTDFSKFQEFQKTQVATNQAWSLAAGFELTPDQMSMSSYMKRITYRTGVSFEQYPYLINGNFVNDFGINFGFSLPVSRISSVDLATRWGKRGNIGTIGIEENYFKIYFGVTFNDRWFIKRRFD